jgi:hypothetical protein
MDGGVQSRTIANKNIIRFLIIGSVPVRTQA